MNQGWRRALGAWVRGVSLAVTLIPMASKKLDYDHSSFTAEGRRMTLDHLRHLLDKLAPLGIETDEEAPDEPSTEEHVRDRDGTAKTVLHVPELRRPLRAYRALRDQGMLPEQASQITLGHLSKHPTNDSITVARVRFDAVSTALALFVDERPPAETFAEVREEIECARKAQAAIARHMRAARKSEERRARVLREANGLLVRTVPSIADELSAAQAAISAGTRATGVAASTLSPDLANLVRGPGRRASYSLGRVLITLSQGVVSEWRDGVKYGQAYEAFTVPEMMKIVVDEPRDEEDSAAERACDKRYRRAMEAYREMRMEQRTDAGTQRAP